MIAAMWSGGKDSCLAVWKVIKAGKSVDKLICILNEDGKSRAHGLYKDTLIRQANAIGIDIIFGKRYDELKEIVKLYNIKEIVFGDIYLEVHRNWIENFCKSIEVKPIFPLWGCKTLDLAKEFISEGFKAYIVAVRKNLLNLLGKKFDEKIIDYLVRIGIDPCGENGEFHTFVFDGPLFKQPVEVKFGKVWRNEKYYIIEILQK